MCLLENSVFSCSLDVAVSPEREAIPTMTQFQYFASQQQNIVLYTFFFFSISENSNIISKYDTQNCSMKIFLFWPLLCNKQMCSWNLWVCHLKFHQIWFQQVIHLYITLPGGLKTENLLVAAVTRHWDFGRCGKMDTDFLFSNENRKKLIIYILLNFD